MPKWLAIGNAIKMATVLAAFAASSMTSAEPLRVCSDPDNLPFSKSEGPTKGLYVEVAELIGKRLGVPVEYVWYLTYHQRRALRNTMDGCDAYFALPVDADYKVPGIDRTAAFLDVRYAVVTRPERKITTIDDLKGQSIGVTFGSTPQVYFSAGDRFRVKSYRDSQEVVAAIEAGEVDAGVLWGPHIGYLNLTVYQGYWSLTPISGKGLGGPVAIAVPKGRDALRGKIDEALAALQPEIAQLARKYGFPSGVPLTFETGAAWHSLVRFASGPGAADTRTSQFSRTTVSSRESAWAARGHLHLVNDVVVERRIEEVSSTPHVGEATVDQHVRDASGEPRADEVNVERIRAMFNSRCAHCHSQNGASPQPERDLRRLSRRYGDNWREVARTTIINGRSGYGMPNWGETLSQQEIDNVLVFLETIQKKP